jgi:hypothetical protein
MTKEPARSIDAPVLSLAELADELADRLAGRLAAQLAELAHAAAFESMPDDGWWTAARVAAHYNVGVRFIYEHADELGCVRLGGGRRPRLRFDPTVVARRWSSVGDTLPQATPSRRWRDPAAAKGALAARDYELIEFDRDP